MKIIYEFFKKVADFRLSCCLPIEGTFLQILYNSQIFVLINEIIKCFSNVVAGFSRSRRLLLEGIFYRRTNSAFSIRYIGEKISRLNLRRGCVRQSMDSMDIKFEHCPHKYIIAIRVKGGYGR